MKKAEIVGKNETPSLAEQFALNELGVEYRAYITVLAQELELECYTSLFEQLKQTTEAHVLSHSIFLGGPLIYEQTTLGAALINADFDSYLPVIKSEIALLMTVPPGTLLLTDLLGRKINFNGLEVHISFDNFSTILLEAQPQTATIDSMIPEVLRDSIHNYVVVYQRVISLLCEELPSLEPFSANILLSLG